jgi:hypothetical protein
MRKKFFSKSILGIICIFSIFLHCKNQTEYSLLSDMIKNESNKDSLKALEEIKKIYLNAKFHNTRIFECAIMLQHSSYNIYTIVTAADYISKIGYNTKVFISLAQIASICDFDNVTIADLLDLAVLSKSSNGQKIINLAMQSCQKLTLEQQNDLNNQIEKLKKIADFKTLEEAFKDSVN